VLQVEVRRREDLSDRERDELREIGRQAWGASEKGERILARPITWAIGDLSWVVLVSDDQRQPITRAWMLERTILVGGQPVRIGGISGVVTRPERWRQGAASRAMQVAAEFMCGELGVAFGLLLSSRMAVPLYERLGWRVIQGTVVCDQPEGKLSWTEEFPDNPPMMLPCQGTEFPEGPVDLCGLPW
jgi:aminoglycoside 2'-N-acetyltransferase I